MSNLGADLPKPYVLELVEWVGSLTEQQRLNMLYYLCGWKPDAIRSMRREKRYE